MLAYRMPEDGDMDLAMQTIAARTIFVQGYEEAEKELIPLIYRLCESCIFDSVNKADVAKEILVKLEERK